MRITVLAPVWLAALLHGAAAAAQIPQREISPGAAFGASALLPGAGQYLLGEERWVPYVVGEAWLWITFAGYRHDQNTFAQRYRDLAWAVARRVSVGVRRDTIFEYYEELAQWSESGGFDADPQLSGVQPEPDPTTFNGAIWQLARAIYIPGGANVPVGSPEYQRALDYYLRRAVPPGYAWAWGSNNLEQQLYRDLIRQSDDAARKATLRLGLILANHLVSAVDALILARLRDAEGGDAFPLRLESDLRTDERGWRWTAGVRITW